MHGFFFADFEVALAFYDITRECRPYPENRFQDVKFACPISGISQVGNIFVIRHPTFTSNTKYQAHSRVQTAN